jgi:hypothetical protein
VPYEIRVVFQSAEAYQSAVEGLYRAFGVDIAPRPNGDRALEAEAEPESEASAGQAGTAASEVSAGEAGTAGLEASAGEAGTGTVAPPSEVGADPVAGADGPALLDGDEGIAAADADVGGGRSPASEEEAAWAADPIDLGGNGYSFTVEDLTIR